MRFSSHKVPFSSHKVPFLSHKVPFLSLEVPFSSTGIARTCLTYKVCCLSCPRQSCLKLHINPSPCRHPKLIIMYIVTSFNKNTLQLVVFTQSSSSSSPLSLACIAEILFICVMCNAYIHYITLTMCCEC